MSALIDAVAMAEREMERHLVCGLPEGWDIDWADGCSAPLSHELCSRIAVLEAERDRMKAALEDIAYWEGGPKPPHNRQDFDEAHFDCTVKDGCPAMVARAALDLEQTR